MKGSLMYAAIALAAGTTPVLAQSELERLRTENAALKAEILRLKGQASIEEASPARSTQGKPSAEKTYTVVRGDTLTKIARESGCSLGSLLSANKLSKTAIIRPGQVLRIPDLTGRPAQAVAAKPVSSPNAKSSSAPLVVSNERGTETNVSNSQLHSATAPAEEPLPPIEGPIIAKRSVIIDQETTYGSFASRHRTTADQLNALNGFSLSPNTILAKGSEIDVPAQP